MCTFNRLTSGFTKREKHFDIGVIWVCSSHQTTAFYFLCLGFGTNLYVENGISCMPSKLVTLFHSFSIEIKPNGNDDFTICMLIKLVDFVVFIAVVVVVIWRHFCFAIIITNFRCVFRVSLLLFQTYIKHFSLRKSVWNFTTHTNWTHQTGYLKILQPKC